MVSQNTKGVLLINLGTPKSPRKKDVFNYLNEFLTDDRVINLPWLQRQLLVRSFIVPFRYKESTKIYKTVWDEKRGSPLLFHSINLLEKVRNKLPNGYVAELGMRYQEPSLKQALENLRKQHISSLIVLPLYPQYASSTTGTGLQKVMETISKWVNIPAIRIIDHFFDNEDFINSFVSKIREHDIDSYDHVLFSYHGLPIKQIYDSDDSGMHCMQNGKQDCCSQLNAVNRFCYRAQCFATTRALVDKLGLKEDSYSVSFQSRLGKAEWIKPYTTDEIEKLAQTGKKKVLVVCPAFIADCLETLSEISIEYQEDFISLGGEKLQLVESLNDSDDWVDAIIKMVV